jgi:hypothetical protein
MTVTLVAHSTRLKIDWTQVRHPVRIVVPESFVGKVRPVDRERAVEVVVVPDDDVAALVVAAASGDDRGRVATFDEDLVVPLAAVRQAAGVPGMGPEVVRRFADKSVMKQRLAGIVRLPDWQLLPAAGEWPTHEQLTARLGSPFVVKPVDGAGSIGVARVASGEAWDEVQAARAPGGVYEADALVTGVLCHVDTVSRPGAPPQVVVAEYTWPNAEFLDGKAVGSIPLADDDPRTEPLRQLNAKALTALGAGHGVYHLEAFVPEDGGVPVFLEVAARPGGGMITELYDRVLGLNLHAATIDAAAHDDGRLPDWFGATKPWPKAFGTWLWVPSRAGRVLRTDDPSTRGTVESYWRCAPGDDLRDARHVQERVAGMLVTSDNAADARADFEFLRSGYRGLVLTGEQP